MIGAGQWRAYNEACAAITGGAARRAEAEVLAWLAENPGASVAQAREAAKAILAACADDGCRDAAALAAAWYDAQGKAAGAALDRAVTLATVDRESLRKTVHYQAAKLAGGDKAGFAAAVGEWAENEAKASLNATIMANVGRDRRKGVKFARVTGGSTSCDFCLMLASRGAVYHTRQTAGELNRYHRHCSCKIVPCYSGNQYEVLVEGHDPKKIGARLAEVARQTGTAMGTADFRREVSLRDPEWLLGGEAKADYALNPIENYGSLVVPGDYSLGNISNQGVEARDLWAHHVLESYGYRVRARPAEALDAHGVVMDGVTCPDIFLGDEVWEIKSPPPREAAVKPGNELKFINAQMKSADGNFRNPYDVDAKAPMGKRPPSRVILNVRYAAPEADIESREFASKVMAEMKQFRIAETLVIDGKGKIVSYKNDA